MAIEERVEVTKNSYAKARELESFVNGANAPIFGIDVNGLVNEWNDCSTRMTGFTKEEVLGKNLVETYIRDEYVAEPISSSSSRHNLFFCPMLAHPPNPSSTC